MSRRAYDSVVESRDLLNRMYETERVALRAEWTHYDALLEKYHALRVSGANAAEPHVVAAKAEPDVVTQAIIARAGRSAVLRKHYGEYVRAQREAGTDDADIAKAILEGQQLNPEDAENGL